MVMVAVPGSTVFDDSNLVGSGTLRLLGGDHDGDAMEIDGSVGRGLTFELGGGAPTMSLRIDDPGKFHGLIDLTPATSPPFPSLFGFVAFMGLHATSANLHDDMLLMFDCKKLVDTVRLSGGSGLQLEQNSQGVMLSSGGFGEFSAARRSWNHHSPAHLVVRSQIAPRHGRRLTAGLAHGLTPHPLSGRDGSRAAGAAGCQRSLRP